MIRPKFAALPPHMAESLWLSGAGLSFFLRLRLRLAEAYSLKVYFVGLR
jgi:hypothetical protein